MIVTGHEKITLSGVPDWRWWVQIDEPLDKYIPRFGGRLTATPGRFMFARGGRAATEAECLDARSAALWEAKTELRAFLRRPTHSLGARGELIPLGGNVDRLDGPLELG